jgi:hypothetical protein
VLSIFRIEPDVDLDLMRQDQSLSDLAARVLTTMDATLREVKPDLLMVQGDTTTVFAAAVAAFHRNIPVAHVEAGLRSHDLRNPFPEEMNRRLTSTSHRRRSRGMNCGARTSARNGSSSPATPSSTRCSNFSRSPSTYETRRSTASRSRSIDCWS